MRDFAGHRLHTVVAGVSLAIAPLGIVGGHVALALLLAVSVVRWRALWPIWLEALRSPVTWMLGALLAYIGLSLLWSPDPLNGIMRMRGLRALLWAPLLYPLLRDAQSRVPLLLALLAGITILAGTQLWQWADFVLIRGHAVSSVHRFGGLHGEVGKAGLWSATGVCIGVFLCASPRLPPWARIAVLVAASCCLGGLYACATLRALAGATAGMVAVSIVGLMSSRAWRRVRHRRWLAAIVAVALPAVALAGLGVGAERRASEAAAGTAPGAAAMAADPVARNGALSRVVAMDSMVPRVLWWRACWHAFTHHPVAGMGWGATPTIVSEYPGAAQFVAAHPRAAEQHPDMLSPSQPHSIYFMSLGELGAVGTALVLAIVALVLRDAAATAKASFELAGAAAATIMWFVAAGGDTVFNAAVLAAGAILMAFSAPLPRKADAAARSS